VNWVVAIAAAKRSQRDKEKRRLRTPRDPYRPTSERDRANRTWRALGKNLGTADLQIASSVRMVLAMEDVERLTAGRPAEAFALSVVPDHPQVPAALAPDWLHP
jgi:hypothetical protein